MIVEEIAAFLTAQGLGTKNVDMWLHVTPDEPDECLTIYEYAGEEPEFVHDDVSVDTENPRVQIAVRSAQPQVARLRAEQVYQALMTIRNEMLNGTRILRCVPVDNPALVGRDESGRFLVTANFRVKKELTSL